MPSNLSKTPRSHKKLTLSVFDATTCALCVTPPSLQLDFFSSAHFCTLGTNGHQTSFIHLPKVRIQNQNSGILYRWELLMFCKFIIWAIPLPQPQCQKSKKETQTLAIETDFAFWAHCLGEVILGLLWLLYTGADANFISLPFPA